MLVDLSRRTRMADVTVLADELAIRRTLSSYCHLCDDGDFSRLVNQFTPHGALVFGDEVVTGRAELLTWFERNQPPEFRGKHLMTNTVVEVADDRASALSDFVFLRLVDGRPRPAIAGRYRDDLVRTGDRWLLERRDIQIMHPDHADT
jgi:hypothetical protein